VYSADDCTELNYCVACGSANLKPVLDLNTQPLANSYKLSKDEVQQEFPLAINHCMHCHHVQLTHAVNPDLMFKDYLYVSGTSKTLKDYFEWFSKFAEEYYRGYSGTPHSVLDIGCNDGTQLDTFLNKVATTYGVDPAENLYQKSSQHHNVYCGYFNDDCLPFFKGQYIDIINAQNVFAHNSNPLQFLQTASKLMGAQSIMFVQTSQADMILNNEFDTIYHEHISFFNIKSMHRLAKRAGLNLIDVIKTPIHGTSYLFVISKYRNRDAHIDNLMAMEAAKGLYSDDTYVKYAEKCKSVVRELTDYVNRAGSNEVGWNVVGYGAAAKGMTLLNFSKMKLDFIVDDNPLKQGRYTPGASIPIVTADKINELNDTTLFVPLAWNFFKEIKDKIKTRRNDPNDKFITYFPEVKIFQ
jgi:C-methyltransferase C-terminal domain/Putative zinc binding domain/Methyltransferase domain